MTRRWAILIATMIFMGAMFAASPEQAAEVFKVIAPIWLQGGQNGN